MTPVAPTVPPEQFTDDLDALFAEDEAIAPTDSETSSAYSEDFAQQLDDLDALFAEEARSSQAAAAESPTAGESLDDVDALFAEEAAISSGTQPESSPQSSGEGDFPLDLDMDELDDNIESLFDLFPDEEGKEQ